MRTLSRLALNIPEKIFLGGRDPKEGYKSNSYARRFGIKLVPEFYEKYNPIPTRKDAEELEEYVAVNLRKERFGVWFN